MVGAYRAISHNPTMSAVSLITLEECPSLSNLDFISLMFNSETGIKNLSEKYVQTHQTML